MKNTRPTRAERRAHMTMQNVAANGINDEGAMVDIAAQVLGGGDDARATAQAVFNRHFKIAEAN